MKRLLAPQFIQDPSKLFMPSARTLDLLQDAYTEAVDETIRNIIGGTTPSGGYVLRGCVNTIVGPSNSIAEGSIYFWLNAGAWSNATTYGQYDFISRSGFEYISLSAGNINHDPANSPTYWARVGGHLTGHVFQVDAVVLNPLVNAVVAKIVPTYSAGDPATYTDGTTANVHAMFKIVFVDAVSGTGIFDFNDLKTIPEQFIAAGSFGTNWSNFSNAAYRKTGSKLVSLRGFTSGTAGVGSGVMFTLPVGYRPKFNTQFVVSLSGVSPTVFYTISVSTIGEVILNEVVDYATNHPGVGISLYGINFYTD